MLLKRMLPHDIHLFTGEKKRIFDKGFTSTDQYQEHSATGMGLYLAKNAAEALLIHISVPSLRNRIMDTNDYHNGAVYSPLLHLRYSFGSLL